jgi:hypothetical protein
MEEVKVIKKKPAVAQAPVKEKKKVILKNVKGEDVEEKDYFYSKEGPCEAPVGFNQICGNPVEREDLLEVFNKVFKPEDNVLFYKTIDKEVYLIIIPLKYATSVGRDHESINGDFQKHAISFVQDGSVNPTTLRMKLERIVPFVKYTDR